MTRQTIADPQTFSPAQREEYESTLRALKMKPRADGALGGPFDSCLEIRFTDDSVLAIALLHGQITATLTCGRGDSTPDRRQNGPQPTRRQRDYLDFIARYILRYGVSPAESDIARHFLVSPPSVNQMVQMLERRGFIKRQSGVPRSIKIVDYREDLARGPQAAVAGGLRPMLSVRSRVQE